MRAVSQKRLPSLGGNSHAKEFSMHIRIWGGPATPKRFLKCIWVGQPLHLHVSGNHALRAHLVLNQWIAMGGVFSGSNIGFRDLRLSCLHHNYYCLLLGCIYPAVHVSVIASVAQACHKFLFNDFFLHSKALGDIEPYYL